MTKPCLSARLNQYSFYSIFSKMNPGFRQSSQRTFISEKTPFPIFNICPRGRADHFTEDCLEILAGLCEGETTWWNTLLCPKFQLVQGRNLLFSTIWIELSSGGHRTLLEISGLKFLNSKGSTCQSVSSCLHEFMNSWINSSVLSTKSGFIIPAFLAMNVLSNRN